MKIALKKNIPEGVDKYDASNPTAEPDVTLENHGTYTYSFNENAAKKSIQFNLTGSGDSDAKYIITCSHETCIQFWFYNDATTYREGFVEQYPDTSEAKRINFGNQTTSEFYIGSFLHPAGKKITYQFANDQWSNYGGNHVRIVFSTMLKELDNFFMAMD